MTVPIFEKKSISSIGGRGKKNPSQLLDYISAVLHKHANDLYGVMAATGLTTKSLSSMLNGAGKDLATGIAALVKYRGALKKVIDEKIWLFRC